MLTLFFLDKDTEFLAKMLNLKIDTNEEIAFVKLCKILNVTNNIQSDALLEIYNTVDPNIQDIISSEWCRSIYKGPEIVINELNDIILEAYTSSPKVLFPHIMTIIAYVYMKTRECIAADTLSNLRESYYVSSGDLLNIVRNTSEKNADSLYSYSFSCIKSDKLKNYFYLSCIPHKIQTPNIINDLPLNNVGNNVLLCIFSNSLSFAFPFIYSKYYLTNNCNNIAFICNDNPSDIADVVSSNVVRFNSELAKELNVLSYTYKINPKNILPGISDIINYHNICTKKEIDSIVILSLGWPTSPQKIHNLANLNIPTYICILSPDIGANEKIFKYPFSDSSFLCECSDVNKDSISDSLLYLSKNLIEEDTIVSWCFNNHKYKGVALIPSRIDDAKESEMFINPIHLISDTSSNIMFVPLSECLSCLA